MPATTTDTLLFDVSDMLGEASLSRPFTTRASMHSRRPKHGDNRSMTPVVPVVRAASPEEAALEAWVMSPAAPIFTTTASPTAVPFTNAETRDGFTHLHPQTESLLRKSERMGQSEAVNQPSPYRWRERLMKDGRVAPVRSGLLQTRRDNSGSSEDDDDYTQTILLDMARRREQELHERVAETERRRISKLRALVSSPATDEQLTREGNTLKFIVERLVASAKTERDFEETEAMLVRARQSQIMQCEEAVDMLEEEKAMHVRHRDVLLEQIDGLNHRAEEIMAVGILHARNHQRQQQSLSGTYNTPNQTPHGRANTPSPAKGSVAVSIIREPRSITEMETFSPIAAGSFSSTTVRRHINHKAYAARQDAKFRSRIERIWCDPDLN